MGNTLRPRFANGDGVLPDDSQNGWGRLCGGLSNLMLISRDISYFNNPPLLHYWKAVARWRVFYFGVHPWLLG